MREERVTEEGDGMHVTKKPQIYFVISTVLYMTGLWSGALPARENPESLISSPSIICCDGLDRSMVGSCLSHPCAPLARTSRKREGHSRGVRNKAVREERGSGREEGAGGKPYERGGRSGLDGGARSAQWYGSLPVRARCAHALPPCTLRCCKCACAPGTSTYT